MGTYTKIVLKDKTEKGIKKANDSLKRYGATYKSFNGIEYGYFQSMAMIEEDARFMNEDPEGQQQSPHLPRPITPQFLIKNFFWFAPAVYTVKISCPNDDELKQMEIIKKWLTKEGNAMINKKESQYLDDFLRF